MLNLCQCNTRNCNVFRSRHRLRGKIQLLLKGFIRTYTYGYKLSYLNLNLKLDKTTAKK